MRMERNAEVAKDVVVEGVPAAKHFVDQSQERARLRALNYAVIVGAGHDHRLADAEP